MQSTKFTHKKSKFFSAHFTRQCAVFQRYAIGQEKARTTPGVALAMCVASKAGKLFLAVYFVRNGELLTAFGTTRSQNATTVGSRHALTETMLVVSLAIVGLERSFHCCIYRYYYISIR